MKSLLLHKLGTIFRLSSATGIPKSVLQDATNKRTITRHCSSVKLFLADDNKMEKMNFAISFFHSITTRNSSSPSNSTEKVVDSVNNYINIDEKGFRLTFEKSNIYLTSNETTLYHITKSRPFIPKVMHLYAVALPRYDYTKKSFSDGRI